MGYNPKATGRAIESWGELFSKDFKGKVALVNIPQVGTMDVALAMEALGHKKFGDKGNMTKAEIDFLIDYVIPLKKADPPRKRGSHPPAGGGGHGLLRHHGHAAA
jgi:putative spermidine/putrescine transport system substrate-binding protein